MPRPTPLATLVQVAGTRWTVEERFQTGKGLVGLDQHQVRRWCSWYRWMTLAMLAHAVLVVAAVTGRTQRPPPSGLIPLTCNEVQHLFAALLAGRSAISATGCAGRRGDANIRHAPGALPTASRLATMNIRTYERRALQAALLR